MKRQKVIPTINSKFNRSPSYQKNYPQLQSPALSINNNNFHKPPRLKNNSNFLFDIQKQNNNLCAICFRQGKLINPCECSLKYHQACLLDYIKRKIQSMRHVVNFNQINKCKQCKNQFKVRHVENQKCSCQFYCQKLKHNWCQKYLTIFIGLTLLLILLGAGAFFSWIYQTALQNFVFYIFIALCGLFAITLFSFLIILIYFVFRHLRVTQIILYKVYEWQQLMVSGQSISSDQQIYTQNFNVIIEEE